MKSSVLGNNVDAFVPEKDVLVDANPDNPDGRKVQIAVKGVPIPRGEAMKLGLVKPETAGEKAAFAAAEDAANAAANHNANIAAKRGGAPAENKMLGGGKSNKAADDEGGKKAGDKSGEK